MPRYRLLGVTAAVVVFAAAVAAAWVILSPAGKTVSSPPKARVYFAYENTSLRASVSTSWRRGNVHGVMQDSSGIGLRSRCLDTAMFSYLSRNWREEPVKAAAIILTGTFAEPALSNVRAVTSTASSAIVVDAPMSAITLVRRSGRRDYTALIAQFVQHGGCSSGERSKGFRELRAMLQSFRVGV